MADDRDIYKVDKKTAEPVYADQDAPVRKPEGPPHRKAIAILIGMVLLMGAVALIFYQQEEPEFSTEGGLFLRDADATSTNAAATNATPPEYAAIESLFTDLGGRDQTQITNLSPQKMAEAMGHVRSAQQYVRDRDMEAAEREVGKALVVWPDMNIAIRLLGSIYTQRGQFDEAITLLEKSLEREPFSAETLNNLSINYMQKGMMGKAEELLITALQIRPDYSVAHMNLGFVNLRMNRFDLAAENFELGLRQMPGNPAVINNLAVSLIRMGDLEGGRRHLNNLIAEDPTRATAYFNIAITYVMDGEDATALEWLRRGAGHATLSQLQAYLSDPDLDPIRSHPEFRQLLAERFPDVPSRTAAP